MKNMQIKGISKKLMMGKIYWVVDLYNEAGEYYPHVFPDMTVEWRCAEYGLDPSDLKGILEVILYEHYIHDVNDPKNFQDDPAFKRGMKVSSVGMLASEGITEAPVSLYNAPSKKAARDAHLLRISEVKDKVVKFSKHPDVAEDPFDKFQSEYQVDMELVNEGSKYVEKIRNDNMNSLRVQASATSDVPRKIDRYKELFNPPKGSRS